MDLPLHEACMSNNLQKAQEVISKSPHQIYSRDADYRIPLHWAVSFQYEEIVWLLLSKMMGVNLFALKDESEWTPFHIACAVGNLNIAKKLQEISSTVNLNLTTSQGITPLHLAVTKNHRNICEYLLSNGASVYVKNRRQQIPLHCAAAMGSIELVDILCKADSPLNRRDIDGWTPLFHALAEGHGFVAVLLVRHGASCDIETADGHKAIDFAANDEVKRYFLDHISKSVISNI